MPSPSSPASSAGDVLVADPDGRCPRLFHEIGYLSTLGLGDVSPGPGRVPFVLRPIPGTSLRDAVLPWPYSAPSVTDLCADPSGPVTIVGVLSPAMETEEVDALRAAGVDVTSAKEHFVFDPGMPRRSWGGSTRTKIRRGERDWSPVLLGAADLDAVMRVYRALIARRGASSSYWNFEPHHFGYLLQSAQTRCVGMVDSAGELGAFIILATSGQDLHAVHIASTDRALATWATYALMAAVVGECERDGCRLFLGGVPGSRPASAGQFKERWSTGTRPAWLATMVVDHDAYASLPIRSPAGHFPRYRAGWS